MAIADLKALKVQEGRSIPGVYTREPKQAMLDVPKEVIDRHPDKHLRWVNIKDPQKAESRQMDGYVRLTPEEGGRQLGSELALFAAPKASVEARKAFQEKRNRELLTAHVGEMEQAAQSLARELRDQHGFDVNEKDILVKE